MYFEAMVLFDRRPRFHQTPTIPLPQNNHSSLSFSGIVTISLSILTHSKHSASPNPSNQTITSILFLRTATSSPSIPTHLKQPKNLITHSLMKDSALKMLGYCDGLLALYNSKTEISLLNPLTRKSQMLPVTEIESPPYLVLFIVYGLGHDPIFDDYKLVRMVQLYVKDDNDSFDYEVKVYSLRTNSWRRIKNFPFFSCTNEHMSFVGVFDLGTEEYRVVDLPDCWCFVDTHLAYIHH
ncbi:hypothetical protein GQ457_15G011640 [Hibiscus cannabinus]